MGGVDPSRHHGLVYGSRLISYYINSLYYMFAFAKYSLRTGGSKSKQLDVLFLYKQVNAFVSRTLTLYCFAIGFKPIF